MKSKNELVKKEEEMATIEVPDSLWTELDAIAKDARNNFITRGPEGLEYRNRIYEELFVQILEWKREHYRWRDGKEKEVRYDLTDKEAEEQGYKRGAELLVKILNPKVAGEIAKLSLPISCYVPFSEYSEHLTHKGLTPTHMVTKLGTVMTQFKVGKPQPVITFEPDRFIQDWWQAAPDKEAGQTTVLEVEGQSDESKPSVQSTVEESPPATEDDNTIDNWT